MIFRRKIKRFGAGGQFLKHNNLKFKKMMKKYFDLIHRITIKNWFLIDDIIDLLFLLLLSNF